LGIFIDEIGELGPTITAPAPRVTKPVRGRVAWSDLVNDKTGKVPIIIRSDILESDEAIVAVFAHELFEIERFREVVRRSDAITIEVFIANHTPDNPGNFHDQAWDVADALVRRMRGVSH
jgi:hypothetical protein